MFWAMMWRILVSIAIRILHKGADAQDCETTEGHFSLLLYSLLHPATAIIGVKDERG
jgi:hypothetical protein